MFELLNELLGDASPLYIYLSIGLTFICAYRGLSMNISLITRNNEVFIKDWHAIELQLLPIRETSSAITKIQNWIANKTRRIEAPDDDTDTHSSLLKAISMKLKEDKNGGKICIHIPCKIYEI